MKKLEKDGKIAVVYSPAYGAGWSTWNSEHREFLCMDADIATAVLQGDQDKAVEIALREFPDMTTLGGEALMIQWVPKGTYFEILEYDGSESVRIFSMDDYMKT